MNIYRLFLNTVVTLCVFSGAALAQEDTRTQIIVDEAAGVIRFLIAGDEQARLTEEGLQVRGDIVFGGMIRDAGGDALPEEPVPASESEAQDAP